MKEMKISKCRDMVVIRAKFEVADSICCTKCRKILTFLAVSDIFQLSNSKIFQIVKAFNILIGSILAILFTILH